MGATSAKKLVEEIRKALEKITYPSLMAASCVFPEGLGKTMMEKFISYFPDWEFRNPSAEEIEMKEGFGPVRSKQVADFLPVFKEWLSRHPECRPKPKLQSLVQDLIGEVIIFSGFRDEAMKENLISRGATVKDNWVNAITAVITKDINSNAKKVEDARKGGKKIVGVDYFFQNH
jgi:hypothetical protein